MMNKKMHNPFELLGVDEAASSGDIKKAYFQKVRQYTPEKHAEKFKQIREAYDTLKDSECRLEAEVFNFIRPQQFSATEDSNSEFLFLNDKVFLSWFRENYTDLERTDFTDDIDELF